MTPTEPTPPETPLEAAVRRLEAEAADLSTFNFDRKTLQLDIRLVLTALAATNVTIGLLKSNLADADSNFTNLTKDYQEMADAVDATRIERDTAESALAEARRDTQRLDWLTREQPLSAYVNPFRDVVHRLNGGLSIRAAIDSAMLASGKEEGKTT